MGRDAGFYELITSPWIPAIGTWYHLAWTYDGELQTIYINGVSVASAHTTGSIGYDTHPVYLGADNEYGLPGLFFHDGIDEASIYNRALSAEEVLSIYDAGSAGKCKLPIFASIDPSARAVGRLYRIGTSVALSDTNDSPVGNARVGVAVKFPDGDVNGALPRADADGKATLSFLTSQTGTYTFTDKGVRKPGRTYDPALNVETSDSITIP